MSAQLSATLQIALSQLDQAAREAALHEDPLERPFAALAAFLHAQHELYADADVALARHIETAKQPVRNEELRQAVLAGISAHARDAVRAVNWQTTFWLALSGLALAGLGFIAGAWWQSDSDTGQLTTAQNVIVEAHAGFPAGMRAQDVALWQEVIRINPRVEDALHDCRPLKLDRGGSACALPIWTLLPPPVTQTPATH
jgi:hypothetical protein